MKKRFVAVVALVIAIARLHSFEPLKAEAAQFLYDCRVSGTLEETGSMSESSSRYFWLNSGGWMQLNNGTCKTQLGDLLPPAKWNKIYAASNPTDTDIGLHPQNIFRLLTKTTWQNFSEQAYFKVTKTNLSASPNREGYNGFLFFNRYLDSQNLYYTGIRVDGAAVIKKKIQGRYYTMAFASGVYPGIYNRDTNPNLIPRNQWIGLRSVVQNNADGKVSIKLYIDKTNSGTWTLVAEANDDGKSYGGAAITTAGYGGIRTDFMDIEWDDLNITSL